MATPSTTTYEFDQVTASFASILIDGYAEGGGITVEPAEVSFVKYVGADGKVTRTKKLNRTAKVRIRIAQSSLANDLLSAYLNADMLTPGGLIAPLYIRDRSGRSLWTAASAWIEGFPSAELSDDTKEREWVFDCGETITFVGGN